jgi:hypothetical protein
VDRWEQLELGVSVHPVEVDSSERRSVVAHDDAVLRECGVCCCSVMIVCVCVRARACVNV